MIKLFRRRERIDQTLDALEECEVTRELERAYQQTSIPPTLLPRIEAALRSSDLASRESHVFNPISALRLRPVMAGAFVVLFAVVGVGLAHEALSGGVAPRRSATSLPSVSLATNATYTSMSGTAREIRISYRVHVAGSELPPIVKLRSPHVILGGNQLPMVRCMNGASKGRAYPDLCVLINSRGMRDMAKGIILKADGFTAISGTPHMANSARAPASYRLAHVSVDRSAAVHGRFRDRTDQTKRVSGNAPAQPAALPAIHLRLNIRPLVVVRHTSSLSHR